jgi:hypothetical protein
MDTEKFEASEWELINPKNISFGLNNHDGLIWELMVFIKAESGYIRGMPIGFIVQANPELEDGLIYDARYDKEEDDDEQF